jgi:hypothetical protein
MELATPEEVRVYKDELNAYTKEWVTSYSGLSAVTAELLWNDFTSDFCEFAIQSLNDTRLKSMRDILLHHGVFVKSKRGFSRQVALLECHRSERLPQADAGSRPEDDDNKTGDDDIDEQDSNSDNRIVTHAHGELAHGNLGDRGKESSFNKGSNSVSYGSSARLPGLAGLMKAYGSRKKYTGGFDEDLSGILEEYEMTSRMCGLTADEKRDGIVIMLEGPAMAYYAAHLKDVGTYDELVDGLKLWYTSEEQRSRLLRDWHGARLSKWLQENPNKSEISVFRDLAACLSKIQRQLSREYHKDIFLKDQLVAAADVPIISRALREKPPKTAHEAQQRIASLLEDAPGSAGANISVQDDDKASANYGLGQRFSGDARRKFSGSNARQRGKEKTSIARIKGCWVCGKDHRARSHHSKKDIEEALENHKKLGAFVSAEDVVDVCVVATESDEDSDDSPNDDNAYAVTEILDLNAALEQEFSNLSFAHTCGYLLRHESKMREIRGELKDLEGQTDEFKGVIIDTGANRASLMSLAQYRAYCKKFKVPAKISGDQKCFKGIAGGRRSIGSALVTIPFPKLGICSDVLFSIMKESVPTLLSLKDLRRTGVDLSIQRNVLTLMGQEQPLSTKDDFLWHRWHQSDAGALFTESELKSLHRSFGHPSAGALYRLLKRARPEQTSATVQEAIEELTKQCGPCEERKRRPRRFKLTLGSEDLSFNSVVAVDVMYLDGDPILHVVDEATHFAAASYLRNVSARETWRALTRCWSHVYMGPPDYLRVDQGTNFISKEFQSLANAAEIAIIEAPVEHPSSMTHVERYHGPLRAAFEKLCTSLQSESKEDLLQLAVSCVNNTTGPEGLCPTLCVFGALPRPARVIPAPTQLLRAKAIDEAMNAVSSAQAKAKIAFGLRYKGPYGGERSDLSSLVFGSPVRVYRTGTNLWDGPFKFVSIDGDVVCVETPAGRKIFSSNAVKPATDVPGATKQDVSDQVLCAMFGETGHQVHPSTFPVKTFQHSRKQELAGLKERGVFEIVSRSCVPRGIRIYGMKWVDTTKSQDDGSVREKSRLVAQNYRDEHARDIPTKAPTISRMGERLALCFAAMHSSSEAYVRDVTQAYLQATSDLERSVFLNPVPEMGLQSDEILRALKPLYGIPESGLHWFLTYSDHHVNALHMTPCAADRCLFFRKGNDGGPPSTTALQVDDSFGSGDKHFLAEEEAVSVHFKTKPRKLIKVGSTVKFNGSTITRPERGKYVLQQEEKLRSLIIPRTDDEAVSARAKIQYVASMCRPDVASVAQLLASAVRGPISNKIHTRMRELISYCHETADIGLNFVNLNPDSLRLILFTDASFGNAEGLSSQLGFVVALVDDTDKANIVHYGSQKSKRVTRSVLAAEVLGLVYGWDQAFVVQHTIQEVLGRTVPVDAYVDSRTTFDCVAKNAVTLEKRLAIDVSALRQSHSLGELSRIGWVPGIHNPADGLTRSAILKQDHPLIDLMVSNTLRPEPEGWAESRPSAQK